MNKIFIDMDNTIANFEGQKNSLQRFETEKRFFFKLLPMEDLTILNDMVKDGNIYIISSSPNENADFDKILWLRKYLPNLVKDNILLCRPTDNKAIFIENKLSIEIDKTCLLVDDYTKNLQDWKIAGGIGIKRISKFAPNSTKKWKGMEIHSINEIGRFV